MGRRKECLNLHQCGMCFIVMRIRMMHQGGRKKGEKQRERNYMLEQTHQRHFTQPWRRKKHHFRAKIHFNKHSFFFQQSPPEEVGTCLHTFLADRHNSCQSSPSSHLSSLRPLNSRTFPCGNAGTGTAQYHREVPPRLLALPSKRRQPLKGGNKFLASVCAYITRWGR